MKKLGMLIAIVALGHIMSGCATIPQGERGYTVQSHTVVLGLYIPLFDFLGGQSPTKLALGYITHDMQVVPEGVSASQEKMYEGVLGDNDILSEQTVQAGKPDHIANVSKMVDDPINKPIHYGYSNNRLYQPSILPVIVDGSGKTYNHQTGVFE